jgi:hypothetical protein
MTHQWKVLRKVRNTEHPLIRECQQCAEVQRHHRGRWVMTHPALNECLPQGINKKGQTGTFSNSGEVY